MTDMTKNDMAYLKVAQELRRVENSLQALESLRTLCRNDSYIANHINKIRPGEIYVPEIQELLPMVELVKKGVDGFSDLKEKLEKRLMLLQELSDTYLKGGDILINKLSKE